MKWCPCPPRSTSSVSSVGGYLQNPVSNSARTCAGGVRRGLWAQVFVSNRARTCARRRAQALRLRAAAASRVLRGPASGLALRGPASGLHLVVVVAALLEVRVLGRVHPGGDDLRTVVKPHLRQAGPASERGRRLRRGSSPLSLRSVCVLHFCVLQSVYALRGQAGFSVLSSTHRISNRRRARGEGG